MALDTKCCYAEFHAECHYAECHYECRYAECRGAPPMEYKNIIFQANRSFRIIYEGISRMSSLQPLSI
jgi:hypothetical protein